MSIPSLVLALAASVPSQNAIAVDQSGARVALQSGPRSVAVYEHRDGEWVPLAAGKLAPDFAFVGPHFVQAGTVRTFAERRIADAGAPIEGMEASMLSMPPLVAGDLAFFWTERFSLGGLVVAASSEGLKAVGRIAPIEGAGERMAQVSGLVAFSGKRLAVVDQYLTDQGCKVTIVDRGDGRWKEHTSFRPSECEPGGDDFAPKPPRSRVIGVALDGDRLALGTEPTAGIAAGEVLLYRRGKDGWQPAGSIPRPPQPQEPAEEEGFVPHGFGRRIVLDGPRAFVSDTWSKPIENGYSSVYNGVFVLIQRDGGWEQEKRYVHAVRQAMFGADFEVRGTRLFIDSMNENAVYVFERREGEWQGPTRVPKDEPAPSDAKEN